MRKVPGTQLISVKPSCCLTCVFAICLISLNLFSLSFLIRKIHDLIILRILYFSVPFHSILYSHSWSITLLFLFRFLCSCPASTVEILANLAALFQTTCLQTKNFTKNRMHAYHDHQPPFMQRLLSSKAEGEYPSSRHGNWMKIKLVDFFVTEFSQIFKPAGWQISFHMLCMYII